ncbi:UNVERIFIED_CONTAM: hypothetical protein HHA_462240 [Hammondia hammondi]|eukprot:XP_008885035.1 hypothetical protein HHA_462240 [Hammondia hammondi]
MQRRRLKQSQSSPCLEPIGRGPGKDPAERQAEGFFFRSVHASERATLELILGAGNAEPSGLPGEAPADESAARFKRQGHVEEGEAKEEKGMKQPRCDSVANTDILENEHKALDCPPKCDREVSPTPKSRRADSQRPRQSVSSESSKAHCTLVSGNAQTSSASPFSLSRSPRHASSDSFSSMSLSCDMHASSHPPPPPSGGPAPTPPLSRPQSSSKIHGGSRECGQQPSSGMSTRANTMESKRNEEMPTTMLLHSGLLKNEALRKRAAMLLREQEKRRKAHVRWQHRVKEVRLQQGAIEAFRRRKAEEAAAASQKALDEAIRGREADNALQAPTLLPALLLVPLTGLFPLPRRPQRAILLSLVSHLLCPAPSSLILSSQLQDQNRMEKEKEVQQLAKKRKRRQP